MEFLTDWINEWVKGVLVSGILGNLGGLFDNVNNRVGEITSQEGTTPAAWNAGVFSLIRQLSETVVLPIAGLILTFIMCYELIHMVVDRNNLHEIDTWMFFKWVFKTFVAVTILSNTFNIVMGVFDMAQSVVQNAGSLIGSSTAVSPGTMEAFESELMAMDIGALIGLWMQTLIIGITTIALNIIIFVIIYARMVEIFMLTSLAPIPFATLVNHELSHTGQNYLKSLLAIGFQGLLILMCVGIYAALIQNISIGGDPIGAIWSTMGYTVLLCFTLLKTGNLAKSILGAH